MAETVIGLIQTALTGIPVDDGLAKPAPRHVVFYGDEGMYSAGDVAHTSNLVSFRFQLTYVVEGQSADGTQCRWMARKARAALIDKRPTVTGFSCGPIEHESTQVPRPDTDATIPAVFATDSFVILAATA